MEVAERAAGDALTVLREPLPVRLFSVTLVGIAVVITVVLVVLGAPLPSLGAVLLLAVVMALCVNRFALFSSEQAATAEAAVLLAAVVACRDDALVLGPLTVALLVGPLDSLHWQQRSFVRMAYNAGNRSFAALAAVAGFVAVRELTGTSTTAVILGAGLAAVCFAVVDLFLSASLLLLQGNSRPAALRHVVDIDALTLPVACYGAAAGLLASGLGWWATAIVLVPVAFAPEFVLARVRWRGAVVRDLVVALVVLAVLVTLALMGELPDTVTLALLVALGLLAGMELGVDARCAVPPLLAVGVVAAVVVADGDRAFFAASLVAVLGTSTAWSVSDLRSGFGRVAAAAIAAGGGLLAALVYETVVSPAARSIAWPALAAGVTFELVAVTAGADRRRRATRAAWSAPLLATAVACSLAWRVAGPPGGVLAVLVVIAGFAVTTWWGAPPWQSRTLSSRVVELLPTRHRFVLRAVSITALLLMVAALPAGPADVRAALAWFGIALAETSVAMALTGVRQWRFAPSRRALEGGILVVAAALLVLVCPRPVLDGEVWPVFLAGALLASVVTIGTQHARHADRASRAVSEGAHR